MNVSKISIDGADKEKLLNAIKSEFADHYLYSTENISIFTTEKYFLRINSTLLSVIIVNFSENYTTKIEVISGGASLGLLKMTSDAEEDANNKIMNFFNKLCESNSWTFRTD